MADDNSALMLRLFKRLKVEMNGAVVGGMEDRGLHYPLSYGVSLPTICQVASEYKPNNALAILLAQQQVRELQLSAAYVADPKALTHHQVRRWTEFITTDELADVAAQTFAQVEDIEDVALELLGKNQHAYLALQLFFQFYKYKQGDQGQEGSEKLPDTLFAEQVFPAVDKLLNVAIAQGQDETGTTRIVPKNIQTATVNLFREVARRSPSDREFIKRQIKLFAGSQSVAKQYVAQELEWQLDYC